MAVPHIKVIVFDFFGVICPDLAALAGAEFSKRHGIDPVSFSKFGHTHRLALDGGKLTQLEFAAKIKGAWQLPDTPLQLCQELNRLDGKFYAFDAALHDLISDLKPQVKIALMSNSAREESTYLRSLGSYDVFDEVFLSSEYGLTKHEHRWFELVAEKLGSRPEEILLIDDAPQNITTAAESGWTESILYTTSDRLKDQLGRLNLRVR
jgi:HAD superfamily hydrolase (TIGR01509 family)